MADPKHPWDKQPDESAAAYKAFCAYRDYKGAGRRSVDKAYRWTKETSSPRGGRKAAVPKKRAPGKWFKWCRRHHWVTRAEAWDSHIDQVGKAAAEEGAADAAAKWTQRREAQRERVFHLTEQLLDRAEQMLRFPLAQIERVEVVGADGKPTKVTHIHPAGWRFRDAIRFIEAAEELGGAVVEESQEQGSAIESDRPRVIAIGRKAKRTEKAPESDDDDGS